MNKTSLFFLLPWKSVSPGKGRALLSGICRKPLIDYHLGLDCNTALRHFRQSESLNSVFPKRLFDCP